jgi:hypothetical protein
MKKPPQFIKDFAVIEYGFLPEPTLPTGYVPPNNGGKPLEPMQNFAVCTGNGVEGYYLLCCTSDWRYMTYCFEEQLPRAKAQVVAEFGSEVELWHRLKA